MVSPSPTQSYTTASPADQGTRHETAASLYEQLKTSRFPDLPQLDRNGTSGGSYGEGEGENGYPEITGNPVTSTPDTQQRQLLEKHNGPSSTVSQDQSNGYDQASYNASSSNDRSQPAERGHSRWSSIPGSSPPLPQESRFAGGPARNASAVTSVANAIMSRPQYTSRVDRQLSTRPQGGRSSGGPAARSPKTSRPVDEGFGSMMPSFVFPSAEQVFTPFSNTPPPEPVAIPGFEERPSGAPAPAVLPTSAERVPFSPPPTVSVVGRVDTAANDTSNNHRHGGEGQRYSVERYAIDPPARVDDTVGVYASHVTDASYAEQTAVHNANNDPVVDPSSAWSSRLQPRPVSPPSEHEESRYRYYQPPEYSVNWAEEPYSPPEVPTTLADIARTSRARLKTARKNGKPVKIQAKASTLQPQFADDWTALPAAAVQKGYGGRVEQVDEQAGWGGMVLGGWQDINPAPQRGYAHRNPSGYSSSVW